LRYLARYTHRVAISNRRLVALNDNGVTFKWKDYRLVGPERYGLMTLDTHEFIRRFLMHVLPQGFHRIRYYGLLTSPTRAKNIARIRALLAVPLIPIDAIKAANAKPEEPKVISSLAISTLRPFSMASWTQVVICEMTLLKAGINFLAEAVIAPAAGSRVP
jgi:hypothetical protein